MIIHFFFQKYPSYKLVVRLKRTFPQIEVKYIACKFMTSYGCTDFFNKTGYILKHNWFSSSTKVSHVSFQIWASVI